MATIGEIIAEVRNDIGMSQADLAQRAGVSKTTIWSIENNQTWGSRRTIEAVSSALSLSVAELYKRAGVNHIAEGYETDPLVTRLKLALERVPGEKRDLVVRLVENMCEVISL